MTKKKIIILAAIVVAVAAVVTVNLRASYEPSVKVEATKVSRGRIVEKVSGPGVIYATSSVKISSSVMGRITRLAVKEGDNVAKSSLLLEIDSSQYQARLRQADAAHKAALARKALSDARLSESRLDWERVVGLSDSKLVSDKELEAARTTLAVGQAEADAAGEAASEASAALMATRDDLRKTTILSPIAGTVTSLNVEEGEIVITGTMNNPGTVIMTISNLDTMEVRAEIDETDVARISEGQKAEISVDAFTDSLLQGSVSVIGSSSSSARSLAASVDERSRFEVRIRIRNFLPGLRPGMTSTVDVVTATRDSAIYVPIQALVLREVGEGDQKQEEEGVFTIDKGRAKFVAVKTGISDDKNIEVPEGLALDTEVVTGPFKVLRDLEDKAKVKPTSKKE